MQAYGMAWVRNQYRAIFDPRQVRKKGKNKLRVLYRSNGKIIKEGKHYRTAIIDQTDILTVFP